MSRIYQATGINLKGMPLGESDRLLTILTREVGLIQAVAPGARKHHSSLGGRSELFVVNQLSIVKGRSLDKITQAETKASFPGLSRDLSRLTAGQYLAELTLFQALSDQPQEALFSLLCEHLQRLENLPRPTPQQPASLMVLAFLAHATFHLLALAGVAPQVHHCCLTRRPLMPPLDDPDWRVGFSVTAGGILDLAEMEGNFRSNSIARDDATSLTRSPASVRVSEPKGEYTDRRIGAKKQIPDARLSATELAFLQQLAQPDLPRLDVTGPNLSDNTTDGHYDNPAWLTIERVLRQYAQYHFDRPLRSAALIEACFQSVPTSR